MSLNNHIQELRAKHQALDKEINNLQRRPNCCSLVIRGLKKEKLQLKEKIKRLSTFGTSVQEEAVSA